MFLRGFYNSAQAMLVKQRELDAVSNNLANVNKAGYRKDEVVLNTFMRELILVQNRKTTSGTFEQQYADAARTSLEQSNFEYTESKFDMAIWGNVYFNVTDRYGNTFNTRAGQFELDNEGYLCLGRSGRVQGQNGDIYLGNDDFIVEPNGTILNTNGEPIDALMLTYIPPNADVRKVGDSLFRYDGDETLPEGETYDVIQGAFEKSNVDGNKEMTKMIEIQRLFEANSAILKRFDAINSATAGMAKL